MDGFLKNFFFLLGIHDFVMMGWEGFSTMFLESGFHYYFFITMDRWMNG